MERNTRHEPARAATLAIVLAGVMLAGAANAAPADEIVLDESRSAVKTQDGKIERRFRTVYDTVEAQAYRETWSLDGQLLERRALADVPSPDEADRQRAHRIVRADPIVQEILARQGGLDLNGGFVIRQLPGAGPCVAGTRCVQMFLFDGENVVRHMLVDLRSERVLVHDYTPPRNREVRK